MSELTPIGRQCLLLLARAALEQAVAGSRALENALEHAEILPELHAPRGAFVSLMSLARGECESGTLRGCVGTLEGSEPLYQNVIEVAPKAALLDPRFTPLEAGELTSVRIEITVLTPLRKLGSPEEIVIGRDGVELRAGPRHAVFLPQVARDQRWTAEQLLRHLAVKAGLGPDGWRLAELNVFCGEVFGELSQPGLFDLGG